jgi:hypothetical protein
LVSAPKHTGDNGNETEEGFEMSDVEGTAVEVTYEETTWAVDEDGNAFAQTTEVEATAYDFDGDGTVDYVEGEAHTEVYAQDENGNWATPRPMSRSPRTK